MVTHQELTSGPVRPEERIAILDILRGWALLGIAILNMGGFKAPGASWSLESERFPGTIDRLASWAIEAFGSGKFNSTFSFLFGVGLTIQMARAEARGVPFVGLYLRRLAVLLVLGICHSIFLWDGDVLQIYAVNGLALLLIRKWPDWAVLALLAVLLVAPIVHKANRLGSQEPARRSQSHLKSEMAEQLRIYGRGSYGEQVRDRASHLRDAYLVDRDFWFHAEMGVTMLLGLLAGRRRVFQDLPEHMPLVRGVLRWCLVPGLACAMFAATVDALTPGRATKTPLALAGSAAYEVARPLLSLGYMAVLTMLSFKPGWQPWLGRLGWVGRMPLTNYLMQSVMGTTLFYSFGFRLFGRVGPALGLLVSLAIFGVQVIYSRWWLERFRFGPLEWLWRAITYGRSPTSGHAGTLV